MTCSPADGQKGFFGLGGMKLYGRTHNGASSAAFTADLPTVDSLISRVGNSIELPFDPTEVIENLRWERYASSVNREIRDLTDNKSFSRRVYYALRPFFPVPVRRIIQRIALRDWANVPFPSWPLDTTVDDLIGYLWALALETSDEKEIPFIWYWPQDYQACAIMTHDVETGAGQDFCYRLLEIEREFGVRSAFELVPEVRYSISAKVVDAIRQAGSEVCIHGLNHDGRLFQSEEEFRRRAKEINRHAEKWGAKGFRSPIMYRNLEWYDAFGFSYDMSSPNVAHLDPQRGGCCTVFPFFVGSVLELPLTTIQDYPLYNILRTDPMAMWKMQMDAIVAKHGLVSFIIHPDYTFEPKRQALYRELLAFISRRGEEQNVWLALPGEVDAWWRERNNMTLAREGGSWTVQGRGAERASVAYARLEDGKLTYVLPSQRNAVTETVSR
jgi:hypothetical protein